MYRQGWLREQLHRALSSRGIDVVGHAHDGATGSGMTIALAPTVLLLEAQLPSLSGVELARRVSRCSPATLVFAQAPHHDDLAALLAAGVRQVWSRYVLPVVIAADIAADIAAVLEPGCRAGSGASPDACDGGAGHPDGARHELEGRSVTRHLATVLHD